MKALCEQANVNPQKVFPHNLRRTAQVTFAVFSASERDALPISLPANRGADKTCPSENTITVSSCTEASVFDIAK